MRMAGYYIIIRAIGDMQLIVNHLILLHKFTVANPRYSILTYLTFLKGISPDFHKRLTPIYNYSYMSSYSLSQLFQCSVFNHILHLHTLSRDRMYLEPGNRLVWITAYIHNALSPVSLNIFDSYAVNFRSNLL